MAKRNFILTKKALSSYLHISRNTLHKRLGIANVDISDMEDILDWLIFCGMGIGRLEEYISRYILRHRGKKCEQCGSPNKLHLHHKNSRRDFPKQVFIEKNIKILCVDCHSVEDGFGIIKNSEFYIGHHNS